VAASTATSAAHGNSISHDKFMRASAAIAPNRKLCEGFFVRCYISIGPVPHYFHTAFSTATAFFTATVFSAALSSLSHCSSTAFSTVTAFSAATVFSAALSPIPHYFHTAFLTATAFFTATVFSAALSLNLHTTTQRLGAAAASTNSSAAHGNSISHEKFMRVTAAVAPNRKLAEVLLSFCPFFILTLLIYFTSCNF
jgi:hypothetical protein